MITEDYVSFEIAKLLKEKGFDVYGDGSFNSGIEVFAEYSPSGTFNKCTASKPHQKAYAAPTLQMAMKWLREVHSLSVEVQFFLNEENDISSWNYDIIDIITYCNKARYAMCVNFETYEQAVEAALKYTLENLI